jgi:hypothetical protein
METISMEGGTRGNRPPLGVEKSRLIFDSLSSDVSLGEVASSKALTR